MLKLLATYLPLPSAIAWSPSVASLVNNCGNHCINCSDEKPRIKQFVKIAMYTIAFITVSHTPISFPLQQKHTIQTYYQENNHINKYKDIMSFNCDCINIVSCHIQHFELQSVA